ncbi:MAG: cupin domain-containing protein [Methylobacter sp.]|nr:cupin domain-containing protein [Methylobacter sp.]
MKKITVDSNPSKALLKKMGVANWPTWEKEVSAFPWEFVTTETALILEGECVMTPADGGPSTTFKAGDLVVFPLGYKGTWEVKKALKKRFKHNGGNIVKCFFNRMKIWSSCAKSIMK